MTKLVESKIRELNVANQASLPAGRSACSPVFLPLVYDELKRIARGKLMSERANHTLSPTALVHEAWLKLRELTPIDQTHFFALAARAMRQILVNHALATNAQKRSATRVNITEVADLASDVSMPFDLIALDQCLQKLELHDPRAASLAELRAFAGMSLEQAADALSISIATAKRDWQYAKLWLLRELNDANSRPAQA